MKTCLEISLLRNTAKEIFRLNLNAILSLGSIQATHSLSFLFILKQERQIMYLLQIMNHFLTERG